MTTVQMHLDDKAATVKRVKGIAGPTLRVYDGRGGYLTLFLNERSVGMLAGALDDCRRLDVTEQVRNVAQDSRR